MRDPDEDELCVPSRVARRATLRWPSRARVADAYSSKRQLKAEGRRQKAEVPPPVLESKPIRGIRGHSAASGFGIGSKVSVTSATSC